MYSARLVSDPCFCASVSQNITYCVKNSFADNNDCLAFSFIRLKKNGVGVSGFPKLTNKTLHNDWLEDLSHPHRLCCYTAKPPCLSLQSAVTTTDFFFSPNG